MKFELRRNGIVITPETEQDRAYIEDTLGLRNDGDVIPLRRNNASGLLSIAYLEARPMPSGTTYIPMGTGNSTTSVKG